MAIKNVIVGQSGGPTAVINASLAGVFKAAKDMGANMVYGMRHGVEGLMKGNVVNLLDLIQTDQQLDTLKVTPSAYLGSCRFKMPPIEDDEEIYKKVFDILEKLNIGHFFYIGGNDSMDTIKKLSVYGRIIQSKITFIGIPKTIDNDLAVTDHTPGYGSAAKYIATAVREVILDATVYDIPTVTIIEIMGRNAGWLTAASALSRSENCDGPDLIYLPERVFESTKFIRDVRRALKKKTSIVVAVSEGIRVSSGRYVCDAISRTEEDAFGHKKLGGTASVLADLVDLEIGCKTRTIEFSTLQRCASHILSKTDVEEAFQAGYKGMELAAQGETGQMVVFERVCNDPYQLEYRSYNISKIANIEKIIPDLWISENGTDIKEELVEYIKPLIRGEVSPVYRNGVPVYLTLK